MLLSYIRFTAELCCDPFIVLCAAMAGLLVKTHPVRVFFLLAFAVSYSLILWESFTEGKNVSIYLLIACRFLGSLTMAYVAYGIRRKIKFGSEKA